MSEDLLPQMVSITAWGLHKHETMGCQLETEYVTCSYIHLALLLRYWALYYKLLSTSITPAPGTHLLSSLVNLLYSMSTNMEKRNFGYLLKNIPIASKNAYMKKMMEKVESVVRRMRWKAIFFENEKAGASKITYGFKTRVCLTRVWQSLLPLFCDKTFEFSIQTWQTC